VEYDSWDPFDTYLEGISLWISDVDLPHRLPVYNVKPCPLLLTMRRIRHNCGGVSDGSWSFHFYHPQLWTQIKTLEPKAGRDMLSIIDCKKDGRSCPVPPPVKNERPAVHQIRPGSYHAGGPYPMGACKPQVIAPCVFSPTKCVCQKLSGQERCRILDIPDEISSEFSLKDVAQLCDDKRVLPMKVALHILEFLWTVDGEETQGKDKADQSIRETLGKKIKPILDREVDGPSSLMMFVGTRNTKATKHDAGVPVHLWNESLVPNGNERNLCALDQIRGWVLGWVKKTLR